MSGALLGFNAAAFVLTLLGGFGPISKNLFDKKTLWRLFAFRSGILLSVAFLEVLPSGWELSPATAGWGALGGFALFFTMETLAMSDSCPEYLESCSVHLIGWTALAALFTHSLIDGLNLTVAFKAGALAGAAIGLALALHKLVDGFTLTALLVRSGYSRGGALALLLVMALATPLGSVLGLWNLPAMPPKLTAGLLGFAAGSFVYIGAADVLPRLHKSEDKVALVLFACGLAVMALLEHSHG